MHDTISRQDAIDAWWHDEVFFGNQRENMTKGQWLDYIADVIESLPSADRPKGEWISGDIGFKCSNCGYGVKPWNNTPFCPSCGADMRGDTE